MCEWVCQDGFNVLEPRSLFVKIYQTNERNEKKTEKIIIMNFIIFYIFVIII